MQMIKEKRRLQTIMSRSRDRVTPTFLEQHGTFKDSNNIDLLILHKLVISEGECKGKSPNAKFDIDPKYKFM